MLSLDGEHWRHLAHAYGSAEDIPAMLRSLVSLPDDINDAEPWFSLWSALAHQGDVSQASFAAVPHVVAALESSPTEAPPVFLHFPAWVEICRLKAGMAVEPSLAAGYHEALGKLPCLAAAAVSRSGCSSLVLQCALAAIAASKGDAVLAEALLELTPSASSAFLEWHFSQ